MANWGFQGSRLDPPPELLPGRGGLLLPQQDVVVFIPGKVHGPGMAAKGKAVLTGFCPAKRS